MFERMAAAVELFSASLFASMIFSSSSCICLSYQAFLDALSFSESLAASISFLLRRRTADYFSKWTEIPFEPKQHEHRMLDRRNGVTITRQLTTLVLTLLKHLCDLRIDCYGNIVVLWVLGISFLHLFKNEGPKCLGFQGVDHVTDPLSGQLRLVPLLRKKHEYVGKTPRKLQKVVNSETFVHRDVNVPNITAFEI